jgi:hypothetical protein
MKRLIFFVVISIFITSFLYGQGPAVVDLGTSGNFSILAKTSITTTGATTIDGNIGVSPAAATVMTGFGLVLDASGTFSKSSLVTGRVYAANYASPTPDQMTLAVSDMEAAYTDAAGRENPDAINADINGETLLPGLYKWTTGLTLSSNVTLSGGPNDVWIFQVAGGITMGDGVEIILIGGAQAHNVFWQSSTSLIINAGVKFQGIALTYTEITLADGATVNGRLLSQTAVTLIGNTIGSDDEFLSITLSLFTAIFNGNSSVLYWITQSEVNNAGWNIYRAETGNYTEASKINATMIEGAGTSSDISEYNYTDETEFQFGETYYYWLESIDYANLTSLHGPLSVEIPEQDNPETPQIPELIGLAQNYPNPFNPETEIMFRLQNDNHVRIIIMNVKGEKVTTIFDGLVNGKDLNRVHWNGKNQSGKNVASGVYFYKLESLEKSDIKKMLLIK